MKINERFWLRISFINLLIVALLGTLMRYKIGFSFPYFDQKNLQHAHSHFAFTGWITQTLFVLMVSVLKRDLPDIALRKYRNIILTNLLFAYGMLLAFGTGGYTPLSIALSTGSIFTSYIFAVVFFKDLEKLGNKPYRNWFAAALWFNVISSLGTFTLGLMMATHNFDHKIHLASLYYYLHFQYNGFFMFACMGLLVSQAMVLLPDFKMHQRTFWIFCISCIPAYFLSALWIELHWILFAVVIISAVAQLLAWFQFWKSLRGLFLIKEGPFKLGRYILLVIALALTVKYFLQLGSTIPAVSKMAFGFRPIVIAYLHLVLLAIISAFLVWYCFVFKRKYFGAKAGLALLLFVAAVYINQLLLGMQGVASLSYSMIPQINKLLFVAAVLILVSILILILPRSGKNKDTV